MHDGKRESRKIIREIPEVLQQSCKEQNNVRRRKVLVLLPTASNKLLIQWKGPYTIVKRVGKVDYKIDMARKIKTYILRKHV